MTKSKFFANSKANELEAMYAAKSIYFNKRSNCIEYIYAYNWDAETKSRNPRLQDYAIRCIGINANGIAFRGTVVEGGKYDGYFYFQYSSERIAAEVILNPSLLYDPSYMRKPEVIQAL